LLAIFRGVSTCVPGDGETTLFWKDNRHQNILALKFPRIYSFALDPDVSLQSMLVCESLEQLAQLLPSLSLTSYGGAQILVLI
jgi:hypothetical protein